MSVVHKADLLPHIVYLRGLGDISMVAVLRSLQYDQRISATIADLESVLGRPSIESFLQRHICVFPEQGSSPVLW